MGKVYSDISNNDQQPQQPQRDVRTFTVSDPTMNPGYPQGQPPQGQPQQMSWDEANNLRQQFSQQMPQQPQGQSQQMSWEEANKLRQQYTQSAQPDISQAKKRTEYLAEIGRLYVDVPFENADGSTNVFTLRSLKGKEMRLLHGITQVLAKEQDPDLVFKIRSTTLKYALHSIDGIDADIVLGTSGLSEGERYAAREEFVEDLDENILDKLASEYHKMIKDKGFRVETPEQAKEVSEDIKKSS